MKLLVIADMEGVSGLAHQDQCDPQSSQYQKGARLLHDEVMALASAAHLSGATSVSVIDWHLGGGNLQPDLLDDRVQLVAEDLSVGYDAVILSGFHAKRGDPEGFISHTMYSERGVSIEIDGMNVGELWLLSRWAGECGIPTILVTGDAAAIMEAARDLPRTAGVAVKTARSYSEADVVPVGEAHSMVASALGRQMSARGRWPIYLAKQPVRFRITFDGDLALSTGSLNGHERDQEGHLVGEVQGVRELIELVDAVGVAPRPEPGGNGDLAA
jgi:D-amino peptidase